MENIWAKALSLLKSEVNEQVFSSWFLTIHFISSDDSSISLGVPNKFFEKWIRDKYFSLVQNAIQQAAGKSLSIKFEVVEPLSLNPEETETNRTPVKNIAPKNPAQDKDQPVGGWLKSVFAGSKALPESQYQKIGLNENYTFDDFVVGESNRFPHAAARAVCDNLAKAYNPLFLYGGVGLGKTHLMQAMGHEILKNHPRAKVLYISSEEFTNQLINAIQKKTTEKFRAMYRNVDILLLDDVQFIAGKNSTQEEFFHTFNTLYDSHKQIVLSSDRSPNEIKSLEERLVTRFAWGLVADVQAPDFETRMAILKKKIENTAVQVPETVIFFLAEHVRTNIRELEGALIRVEAYAKFTGETMTVDLAKKVLGGMISDGGKKITIDLIQKEVSEYFSIAVSEMKSKKRNRGIAYPRQFAMFLSREMTDYSLPDIGGFFGGRDHTTVLHACDKIKKERDNSQETNNILKVLTKKIKK